VLAAASVEWLLVEIEVTDAGELVGIAPALGRAMPGPRRDTAARRRAAEPSLDDLESLDDYCASLDRHEGIGGSQPNAVNESPPHLDRETGEVRQGAVFEPIRELERTENRERGSARPEVEGSLAEMLL
jgi:hypothetical protein